MATDDLSIADPTRLFRRVHPEQVVWDDNQQRLRPTTAVFRDPEMSVNLADDLAREGHAPEFVLRNHPRHHLVALTAGLVRREEQIVCRDHLPDDRSHGIVVGAKPKPRRQRFVAEASWEVLREGELKEEMRLLHAAASGSTSTAGSGTPRGPITRQLVALWKRMWKR